MLRFLAGLIIGRCRPKTHKRAACFDALLAFTSLPKGQRAGQAIMFRLGHYCRAIANRILKVLPGLASSAGSSMRDLSEEAGHGCGGNVPTALRQLFLYTLVSAMSGVSRGSNRGRRSLGQVPDAM
jgi:hypothetical protein